MIKLIKTVRGKYIYDSNLNKVYKTGQAEWEILQKYDEGYISESENHTVKYLLDRGIGISNRVKKIQNPMADMIEDILENDLQLLILQVTQNCNLRCEYCVYSEDYVGRKHNCAKMEFEIARDAIIFFMKRSRGDTVVTINFYGGEPLLNFSVIQECVKYVEDNYGARKVFYGITTNGTILDEEIMSFLEKKRFRVVISLDGNEEENDKNRKYINGDGTFRTIYSKLEKIRECFPELWENISFNRVKTPNHNLRACDNFFKENELFEGRKVRGDYITDNNLKKEILFADSEIEYEAVEKSKALLSVYGKADKIKLDDYCVLYRDDIKRMLYNLRKGRHLREISHPGGVCMPGKERLFVNVKGELFPCERCNELSHVMCIGTTETGFNYKNIRAQMNAGREMEECLNCWAFQLCNICQAQSDDGQNISPQERLKKCDRVKMIMEQKLRDCCLYAEIERKQDNGKAHIVI